MGSIRTLLALSVLLTHSYGYVFVGGQIAVQLFYIISGFLISFILVEARSYTDIKKFYLNRALRLYPIYYAVASLSLLVLLLGDLFVDGDVEFFEIYRSIDLLGFVSLTSSNIFLLGQDWIMFTAVRDGVFQFVTDFRDTEIHVWKGLLVAPAWTLGVEISFYLVAPFVLRSRKLIVCLLAGSLLLRVYLVYLGIGLEDPFTYRFFPTELALFLLGALSHQVLRPWYLKRLRQWMDSLSQFVTLAVLSYCAFFFLLPHRSANTFILMAVFTVSLPFIFHFQSHHAWDSRIGDLSYPIYISHHLVIRLSEFVALESTLAKTTFVIIGTLLLSYVLLIIANKHIEVIRNRNKADRSNQRVLTGAPEGRGVDQQTDLSIEQTQMR